MTAGSWDCGEGWHNPPPGTLGYTGGLEGTTGTCSREGELSEVDHGTINRGDT